MLVEIPDVGMIIGVFIAFVTGLFAIVIYNKIRPLIKTESEQLRSYIQRLQYYENQLIDMKIHMDSLEITREGHDVEPLPKLVGKGQEKSGPSKEVQEDERRDRMHNMNFGSAADYVLKLITEKPMTSRDIQITIGRTREHTSRLMKKLYEEGYVDRDMQTKPFTYHIIEKGKSKIGGAKVAPTQS